MSSARITGGDCGVKAMGILLDLLPGFEGWLSQPVIVRSDMSLDLGADRSVRMIRTISGNWAYSFPRLSDKANPHYRV